VASRERGGDGADVDGREASLRKPRVEPIRAPSLALQSTTPSHPSLPSLPSHEAVRGAICWPT